MKIICTAAEAAEIIYACGGAGLCLRCALRGVCKDKEELFDALHIAEDDALYARKFIQKENDGGLVI